MNFDQLGQAWQDENQAVSTITNREQLIAKTCRGVERFWATIWGRDLRETIVAIALMPIFGWIACHPENAWLESVGAWVIVGGCAFIVYRMHTVRRSPPPAPIDAPLRDYCDTELTRVGKQIMLLRTVLVWYIAPIIGGLVLMSLGRYGPNKPFYIDLAIYGALTWGLHAVNQWAVRQSLVPIRDQLQRLRDRLDLVDDEIESDDHPFEMATTQARRLAIGIFVGCLSLGVGGVFLAWSLDVEYAKRSPFDAVRWRGDQPEVRIEEEWFRFVSIDSVTLDRIASFGKWTFGDPKWKKRFEEDLVEVLTRMGHEPGETVRLVVSPLDLHEERLLEAVPMSEAKRWAIGRSAMTRGRQELPPKYDE